jgi:hypothetical protein
MKIIVENYSFDASEKKVTFTDYNPIIIERVLLIINVTDNIIIYNFNKSTLGGTAATNVLTLTYNTTSMSDTDKLMIFYDDPDYVTSVSSAVTSIVPGTGATNLGKAEDAAHSSSDVGVMMLAVSANLPTARAGSDGDYQSLCVDSASGGLYVRNSISGIGHGVKTVTTAGTDVALAASTPCHKVTIQAQTDNTSVIAVGGSGVDATIATGTGILLYPGDVFELDIDNLADVYIDSLVDGEGVRFTYFT